MKRTFRPFQDLAAHRPLIALVLALLTWILLVAAISEVARWLR